MKLTRRGTPDTSDLGASGEDANTFAKPYCNEAGGHKLPSLIRDPFSQRAHCKKLQVDSGGPEMAETIRFLDMLKGMLGAQGAVTISSGDLAGEFLR